MTASRRDLIEGYLAAYNAGDLDHLARFVTPGYVHRNNDQALTLDQFKLGAAWLRKGMPDFQTRVEDVIEVGDRLAVRWTARGTHQGSLLGEAPTGKQIVLYGATFYRLEGDLIAEDWEAMDEHFLLTQLGVAGT